MEVHKFSCPLGHQFFMSLKLPQPIEDIAPLLKKIQCPVCYSKDIKMYASAFKVLGLR